MIKTLFLSILLVTLALQAAIAQEYEPTAKQVAFADLVTTTPGVNNAEWTSPFSLWIGVDLDTLGAPYKERAKEVADLISNAGKNALNQSVCVHVYYGSGNELAKSCSF